MSDDTLVSFHQNFDGSWRFNKSAQGVRFYQRSRDAFGNDYFEEVHGSNSVLYDEIQRLKGQLEVNKFQINNLVSDIDKLKAQNLEATPTLRTRVKALARDLQEHLLAHPRGAISRQLLRRTMIRLNSMLAESENG